MSDYVSRTTMTQSTRKKDKREERFTDNDDIALKEKKKKRREKKREREALDIHQPDGKEKKRKKDVDSSARQLLEEKKDKKRKHDNAIPHPGSPKRPRVTISSDEAKAYLKAHSINVHLPPNTPALIPITSFDALLIPDRLRAAFSAFKEPTPIQACAWPPALSGSDVVGIAETGSGKTLAFGIPAIARLLPPPSLDSGGAGTGEAPPRALVLAPTRELALQTYDALSTLDAVRCAAVFGGVDKARQVRAVQGAQVVIGTPGRVLDLIGDGALVLGEVEYLVLDEADRMLDKGFENDIRRIIGHAKQGAARQTLMFSATWPEAVRRLASSFLRDPVRITVGSDDLTANSRIAQEIEVFDDEREKDQRLLAHLKKLSPKKNGAEGPPARILVFVLYKKEASRVENTLQRAGYAVGALHGDMTQQARLDSLQQFRDGTTRLLVATDVAARGLDIPDVACVLNYSFPLTVEDYVHRIGRTGRAGKDGRSITFFTGGNHERSLAGELARVLRESGVDVTPLSSKFSMSVKKRTHGVYGAFFREDVDMSAVPKRIVFED